MGKFECKTAINAESMDKKNYQGYLYFNKGYLHELMFTRIFQRNELQHFNSDEKINAFFGTQQELHSLKQRRVYKTSIFKITEKEIKGAGSKDLERQSLTHHFQFISLESERSSNPAPPKYFLQDPCMSKPHLCTYKLHKIK